ncbi:hypothetical protein [Terrirubrum flagellatum]|uniref:COG3904 family protein n=1 Tax=Terrirubrum flagellatum TaxID=2895980 RepID=UPI003CC82D55
MKRHASTALRMKTLAATAAFAAFFTGGARAEELVKRAPETMSETGMRFTPGRLRIAGACETDCAQFIAADGEIGFGSAIAFLLARKMAGERDLPVLLNSPGGYVVGATNLGRMWRRFNVTVIIARATPVACGEPGPCEEKGVKLFDVSLEKAECASACPFALAGAMVRIAPPGVSIGVHETHVDETSAVGKTLRAALTEAERKQAHAESQADIEAFLKEMGVDAELGRRAMKTSYEKVDWLSADDVARYRLSTAGVEAITSPPGLSVALARSAVGAVSTSRKSKSGSGAFTKPQRP